MKKALKDAPFLRSKKTIVRRKPRPHQKHFPKRKRRMAKLTPKQIVTLNKHSKHHSKKHMDMMKKLMREGKTFKAAHTAAQKEVGK